MVQNNAACECPICHESKSVEEYVDGTMVRRQVVKLICEKCPTWTADKGICISCMNLMMGEHVADVLKADKKELSKLEKDVLKSLRDQEIISKESDASAGQENTFGMRLADKVAKFGGSWTFIITFGVVLLAWMAINTFMLAKKAFDPFPYILLNLVLSCLAALQAPVIMMSQNRQEAKDRARNEYDYRINLKAELEVREISMKVDQLLTHQWRRLMEIQKIQLEMMQRIAGTGNGAQIKQLIKEAEQEPAESGEEQVEPAPAKKDRKAPDVKPPARIKK